MQSKQYRDQVLVLTENLLTIYVFVLFVFFAEMLADVEVEWGHEA